MITISKLRAACRTTEIDAVSDRLVIEFDKGDWSSDTTLTSIFADLKIASDKITAAINRIKAESILEEKDEQRDSIIKSINYLVFGFVHHPDSAISNAAKAVSEVFDNYGLRIIGESYATESSLIESLLLDFANADLLPSIGAVPGLTELIANLRTAQTEFEEAKVEFESEKAKEGNQVTASEIKVDILDIINNRLIVYLRAMVMVNEAVYGSFSQTIAQIIDDMNMIVKKRIKSNSTDDEGTN